MRAGRLDRIITIQRKSVTQDESGQEIVSWANLSARRAASYRPIGGEERNAAAQWIARQQVEFRVRWSQGIADLSPLDRVLYPAPEVGNSPDVLPAENEIYDIIDVAEIGRREGLAIIVARRAETPT